MRRRREDDWTRLLEERAALRAELTRGLDALEERAKDPLRIKERIRRHPVVAAGVAAAAGALLANLFLGRRDDDAPRDSSRTSDAESDAPPPDFLDEIRDVALRTATPWIARFVEEHLHGDGADEKIAWADREEART